MVARPWVKDIILAGLFSLSALRLEPSDYVPDLPQSRLSNFASLRSSGGDDALLSSLTEELESRVFSMGFWCPLAVLRLGTPIFCCATSRLQPKFSEINTDRVESSRLFFP